MSDVNSTFLDNTRKDVVGGITAVVFLAGLVRSSVPSGPRDSDLDAFLCENSGAIDRFVLAVLQAALAEELMNEVTSTLGDLIPRQRDYYDRATVNALLSFYAGESQLRDFCAANESQFHADCMTILLKKLSDLVCAVLWCRVDAYERDSIAAALDLSAIHSSCLGLVPEGYRGQLGSSEERIDEMKECWRDSKVTQEALRVTAGSTSGLTLVLAEL